MKEDEATQTPTIWQALDAWSREMPRWQKYVVGTAASQGKLKREQIDVAYELFLIDNKLGEPKEGAEEPEVPAALGRPKEALTEKLLLKFVDSMVGVNALPENSKMTFGEGLTVIYGENGVGKTGFSRLLSNACFSRQQPDILGDIYSPGETPDVSARLHISIGATDQEPISFPIDEEESPLKRITVFDTAVARNHLTQSAPFVFKPAGFDVFPEISRVYGILTEKLDADIAANTKPNEFPNSFAGSKGAVYEAMQSLGAGTDMESIRALATYGANESARIEAIEVEISKLRNQASPESLDAQRQAKADVDMLIDQITLLESHFTDEAVEYRHSIIVKAKETAVAAATLGADTFQRPFFTAVGSREWEAFAQSVHVLAKKESADYPTEEAHCLLCERKLDASSVDHIQALLTFVEGEARKTAAAAQEVVQAEIAKLRGLNLEVFSVTSRVRAHVHRLDGSIEDATHLVLTALQTSRDAAITDLEGLETVSGTLAPSGMPDRLREFSEHIGKSIAQLESDQSAAAIEALEDEKRVLRHRQVLTKLMPQVEEYVSNASWAAKAATHKGGLSTRPVTDKEKALSEEIITEGYRNKLADECKLLMCELPVELRIKGERGETMRTLAMPGGHKPDAILSEGEQKAIALADFLTEVALNPAAAGIILDDPVTSQDYRRKKKIAERLVQESAARQVIIFTHDFVFLNQICNAAEEAGVEITGHWIERDADGKPGRVADNDLPVTSRHYKSTDRAKEILLQARNATGSKKEDLIRQGMAALRSTLEETVVNKLFKEVVPRWSDQVRVTAIKKVRWDNEKADEISDLYEELSGFIEAHSHTDETRTPALDTDLATKIEEVDALIAWARPNRE